MLGSKWNDAQSYGTFYWHIFSPVFALAMAIKPYGAWYCARLQVKCCLTVQSIFGHIISPDCPYNSTQYDILGSTQGKCCPYLWSILLKYVGPHCSCYASKLYGARYVRLRLKCCPTSRSLLLTYLKVQIVSGMMLNSTQHDYYVRLRVKCCLTLRSELWPCLAPVRRLSSAYIRYAA